MVYVDTFPEPRPQTIFARGSHTTVGSSGAGKALNFQALGAEATLWGLLGEDEAGDSVREHLTDKGVTLLSDVDAMGTMRHINLMDNAGDRISIFAVPGAHDLHVDVDSMRAIIRTADVVSVTIMNYCRQFLPLLGELGKPVWVDIHDYDGVNPYHREFIEAADYLFMSSQALSDWRTFLEERIAAGTTAAVCTHGAAGASGITPEDGWIDIAAAKADQVVDTNGAGDAFFAGFAMTWMTGAGLRASLDGGAETAARAVASPDLAPTPRAFG